MSWAAIAVVVAIAVVGVAYYAVVVYPQPNITLVGATHLQSYCNANGPGYTYTFSFGLINTGTASGFAVVQLYLNGVVNTGTFADITYYVTQGAQASEQATIQSPDCGSYSPGIALLTVSKS